MSYTTTALSWHIPPYNQGQSLMSLTVPSATDTASHGPTPTNSWRPTNFGGTIGGTNCHSCLQLRLTNQNDKSLSGSLTAAKPSSTVHPGTTSSATYGTTPSEQRTTLHRWLIQPCPIRYSPVVPHTTAPHTTNYMRKQRNTSKSSCMNGHEAKAIATLHLGKYGRESRCLDAAVDIREAMALIEVEFTGIARTSHTIQAKGTGHYSDQDLRVSLAKCEDIAVSHKSLVDMFQVLTSPSQTKCG